MKLTAKRVAKAITRPGRYGDGHGLYLQVVNTNNASWLLRYERGGRERWLGLGPVHTVGLKDARERARVARLSLLDGIDPLEAKKAAKVQRALAAAKAMTFSEAARSYLDQHSAKWRNSVHAAQWPSTLKTYVDPILGQLPVAEIDVPLVLKTLEQKLGAARGYPAGSFWMTRPETAKRVRGRIEVILDWAKARGYRTGDNPAAWSTIGQVLPARGQIAKVQHHPALEYRELPVFMAALRALEGSAARALEFLILTAARRQEVIGAKWEEIDIEHGVWTVPAGRMKASKEHRVPLSARTVELLESLYREAENPFIFIGPRRAGLSRSAMAEVLKRAGRTDVTVHGFRSSFRDWAAERTAYPNHVVEMALAHAIPAAVEAAYRRGDLLDKRRRLMAEWGKFCASPPEPQTNNVVTMGGP
jgi:integrase